MEWLESSLRDEMDDFPPSCDNIHIEAFAHPYNWTASNEDAGKSLEGYINDFVLPEVNRIYAGQEIEILDPIVISLSMGGLVSR